MSGVLRYGQYSPRQRLSSKAGERGIRAQPSPPVDRQQNALSSADVQSSLQAPASIGDAYNTESSITQPAIMADVPDPAEIDISAADLTATGTSAEQRNTDAEEDMQHVLLKHIISGMSQTHRRQQTRADEPDLQSDAMAFLIQHLSGMPVATCSLL